MRKERYINNYDCDFNLVHIILEAQNRGNINVGTFKDKQHFIVINPMT